MFYNIFLPGGVSGDGYKIYLLKKQTGRNLKDLFTALSLTASVVSRPWLRWPSSSSLSLKPASAAALELGINSSGFGRLFLFFYLLFQRYLVIYIPVVGYSLLVQGLQVAEVWLLLKGLGIGQMEMAYLFVFLFSSLIAIIPVSIGGVGTRELAFLYGAQFLGLSEATSVTVSLLFYAITLLVSLGGMSYSIAPQKISLRQDESGT